MNDPWNDRRTTTVVTVGTRSKAGYINEEWQTVEVHFLRFKELPSERMESLQSREFMCLGRRWRLEVFPGGARYADPGYISVYLEHCSKGSIDLEFDLSVRNEDGKQVAHSCDETALLGEGGRSGDLDFAKRSKMVNALVRGALIVDVRMKQIGASDTPVPPFVPANPLCINILKKFNDEESADVAFAISYDGERGKGARKRAKAAPVSFYAHRLILQDSASALAELSKSATKTSPAQLTDVRPDIFRHMLHYIYGGTVPEAELTSNARDIIDAADKYGVVNLKLQAEACYAGSIALDVENVLDNLLYADSKNCALLKEVVMDFIIENGEDILGQVSFDGVPGSMMTDLLTAVTRGKKKKKARNDGSGGDNDYGTMRVSALRKRLHEKGLEIDGSREAMIAL